MFLAAIAGRPRPLWLAFSVSFPLYSPSDHGKEEGGPDRKGDHGVPSALRAEALHSFPQAKYDQQKKKVGYLVGLYPSIDT